MSSSSAAKLADALETGELDLDEAKQLFNGGKVWFDRALKCLAKFGSKVTLEFCDAKQSGGASGKHRTKSEQVEHKHDHPEGDTRRIITNVLQGEERRREENLTKHPTSHKEGGAPPSKE